MELRCLGYQICAETIYRACYDVSNSSGLPAKCWALLPRARLRRKPRERYEQDRCSVLGDYRHICERLIKVDNRQEPGH